MNYEIVSSNSKGNCIIYKDQIMVDVGVSFKEIERYLPNIEIILLTHKHSDHFNEATIVRIGREFPNILVIVPETLFIDFKELNYAGKATILKESQKFKVGDTIVESFKLFHDVPNIGWKIYKGSFKIIHATDTGSISHVNAKNFDLYAIEHNYDEEIIKESITQKINDGVYAYEIRARDYHLSFQKANAWINSQRKEDSEIVMLHISSSYME